MSIIISILLALLLDKLFKEPKHFHPLVGFGRCAHWVEQWMNNTSQNTDASPISVSKQTQRLSGCVAWSLTVLPFVFIALWLDMFVSGWIEVVLGAFILYLTIGWQSLLLHAYAVADPLSLGQLSEARTAVGMIVSRDTSELDETAIASAATESVLENGADAIFGAIFWFCVLGIPGVVLYRLSNTLDAMWGYKNLRFLHFGWAAARIDDLLNFIPARLTALSYALAGNTSKAISAWKRQAPSWKSPNAGPVMAAGAGAINVSLGGAAMYHGEAQYRPALGPVNGVKATADTILDSCSLVNRALLIWVLAISIMMGLAALTGISDTAMLHIGAPV